MRAACLGALLLTFAAPAPAAAKADSDYAYRLEEVFSAAMRFVRVDRGCKITDKDADAAFVMFECPLDEKDDKKIGRGSLELIRAPVRGQDGVRVQIALPDEGHGVELRWLDLFERKLRAERGAQRDAPKAKPAPPVAAPKPSDGAIPSL